MIVLARWLDNQCARLAGAGYRVWFGIGAGAVLMAIALLAPVERLIPGAGHEQASGGIAQPLARGASGLPLPRFVSLKASPANVRIGPTREHAVAWTYTQPGLPVEIVAEHENWRRIRDSGGNEGWIFHALLSGERMAQFDPWRTDSAGAMRTRPDENSGIAAHVENRALLRVSECDGDWCRVSANAASGFVRQDSLWGVYPGERFR